MHTNGRPWRTNLVIAATSTVVSFCVLFLVGEVFIRATKPHSSPATQRSRSLEYEASLFARHVFPATPQEKRSRWGNSYLINRRGYRGEDFAVPKPAEMTRIVVLGGSAAFDIRASEGRDWPSLLQEDLLAAGVDSVEVINAAVPGHASWDSLGRLYSEIWMLAPDYVIVYHCWNDLKYFDRLRPGNSLLRMYRPKKTEKAPSQLVENPFIYDRGWLDRLLLHSQLYVRLRERFLLWKTGRVGLEGRVVTPGKRESADPGDEPDWGREQFALNLRLLADAARAIDARPVFVTQARLVSADNTASDRERIGYDLVGMSDQRLVEGFEACDEALLQVGADQEVPVIDASEALTGNSAYFEDHVHTTSEGSAALARVLADGLYELLGGSGRHGAAKDSTPH